MSVWVFNVAKQTKGSGFILEGLTEFDCNISWVLKARP